MLILILYLPIFIRRRVVESDFLSVRGFFLRIPRSVSKTIFYFLYFVTRRNSHEEEDHLTCRTALHSCCTRCL
ncbi:hypothetical protein CH367_05600 [Leptospira barantonii]|uniref:Uncharacterized protein n=1 Tax=Leptospira barantonii TaxID=2023184 RepID=A0ABX4NM06_9LEPT|nr:hypothetical protein CH367_05600 [Leptospira barantonii]